MVIQVSYEPQPIPVDNVIVPDELDGLLERLAMNSHDIWALQRFADGWRYGPERSDTERTHPDLVPYVDLSEGEKEYDRVTVLGTVRAILALGFAIVPPRSVDE